MYLCSLSPTQIYLQDYNYQKEIKTFQCLPRLSTIECEILQEVIDGPSNIQIQTFCSDLNIAETQLCSFLQKFAEMGLLAFKGNNIQMDREIKKSLELQLVRLNPQFEPTIDCLIRALGRVPIEILPRWYAIPRSTNHIYASILEKYFSTPRLYQNYLKELYVSDPVLQKMIRAFLSSPTTELVEADSLRQQFKLTSAQFYQYALQFEYYFVAALCYRQTANGWKEVLLPVREWREFVQFVETTFPRPIASVEKIERFYSSEFGFLEALTRFIDQQGQQGFIRSAENAEQQRMILLLDTLDYLEEREGLCYINMQGWQWNRKSLPEKGATVISLFTHRLSATLDGEFKAFNEKDFINVMTSLKRISEEGWLYFDDFFEGFISPIGRSTPLSLEIKGKKSFYRIPRYSSLERCFVERTILRECHECGLVVTGLHEGRVCFMVTSFGRSYH